MAEDLKKVWQDIASITKSLQAKIHEANEACSSMQNQLKESLEENSRLQVVINVLKKKPCTKCAKLIDCVEMLKKKLKEKDNTVSMIGKFVRNLNPESYAAASQEVNEIITSSTTDNSLFEKSLSLMELDESAKPSPKSPARAAAPEVAKTESPIVAEKSRRNKRKFLSISSLRKNKPNGDPVASAANSMKLDDHFNEIKLPDDSENRTRIAETSDTAAERTPPPSLLASPEILTSMSPGHRSPDGEKAKRAPKVAVRKSRRSLDMNLVAASRFSPEAKRKTPDRCAESKQRCEPMDLEIANAVEPLPEIPAEGKEVQSKTVWHLKRSREQLTNSKFKQMLLSTTSTEKKVDISTGSEYKGGSAVQLNPPKSDANARSPCKENETFFEPAITSTHNESDVPAPSNPSKALAESTNKPQTPRKIDDSFDCLPSTSPKFNHQRDAIRKKSERWKLPGQECAKCADFYEAKRADCSDSQIRKLLNKCSRHRHKFPIQVYTPPGLWNPVFDDTDDEVDVK